MAGWASPEMVPTGLSMAAARVLPVAAAGISVFSTDFRVPIGASGSEAAAAERLQFTIGQGPCLDTHGGGGVVLAAEAELISRWPEFHEQLVTATPYRAVACVPLPALLAGVGTMDLYLRASSGLAGLPLQDATTVVDLVAGTLSAQPWVQALVGRAEPGWLHGPGARARGLVSVAMGMLTGRRRVGFSGRVAGSADARLRHGPHRRRRRPGGGRPGTTNPGSAPDVQRLADPTSPVIHGGASRVWTGAACCWERRKMRGGHRPGQVRANGARQAGDWVGDGRASVTVVG